MTPRWRLFGVDTVHVRGSGLVSRSGPMVNAPQSGRSREAVAAWSVAARTRDRGMRR